jgi:hypothetical protein
LLHFSALQRWPSKPSFSLLQTAFARDIAAAGKRAVAVVDFTDLQGKPTPLGRFL